ncbi:MAG TPA: hypothetical protein V6C86_01245 [Oculatellaceae cyanobacterium]
MVGDNIHETHKVEMAKSDMCLLTVGDRTKDVQAHELLKIREQQMELSLAILKAQAHIQHIANKLAAHYPDGLNDVLKHMCKGPAHDYLQSRRFNA